jgi:hypothetical protein
VSMTDTNNPENPDYYAGFTHEQWAIAYEHWGPGALLAHVLKYVLRAGKKPSSSMLRDVRAAKNYLQYLEERLVKEEEKNDAH